MKKKQLTDAIDDINKTIGIEPEIKYRAKDGAKDLINKIQKLQDGEDELLMTDWNPKNPNESLQESTVITLVEAGIKGLPKAWIEEFGSGEKKEEPVAEDTPKASKKSKEKTKDKKSSEEPEKKAPPKAKSPKSKPKSKEKKISNKQIVYKSWSKDKNQSYEDLYKLVEGNVQQSTVKIWISAWSKGKNLPACAK